MDVMFSVWVVWFFSSIPHVGQSRMVISLLQFIQIYLWLFLSMSKSIHGYIHI